MAEWMIEDMVARFEKITSTGQRLPPVRVQGYFNTWPVIVCKRWKTFAADEYVYRPLPPTPDVIDRILKTMRWVQWLEIEQRHLVWVHAKCYGWRDTTIRFTCDHATTWRRWQWVLEVMAEELSSEDARASSKIVGQAG